MKRWISTLGIAIAVMALLLCASCGGKDEAPVKQGPSDAIVMLKGPELFKTKTCNTCHGDVGDKPLLPNYPTIAGQNPEYGLRQIKDIADGTRANGQAAAMQAILALVSPEEMEILAHYVAKLPAPKSTAEPLAADHAGAELYKTKTCNTCHGDDARTPEKPTYAKIAGHNAEYALQQMKDIASGVRANGQSDEMKKVMDEHKVTEEEMALIAEYVATLDR